MPISASSSTTQPCSTALWPTLTPAPMLTGNADRELGVDVDGDPVLDIRAESDLDRLGLGGQRGSVPDAGPGATQLSA
jgi:hypothetical protein